jgi:hypothetical protein
LGLPPKRQGGAWSIPNGAGARAYVSRVLTKGRKQEIMLGVHPELEAALKQQGSTDQEIAKWFSPRARDGEILVRFDRGNGDLTSPLPSMLTSFYFTRKNWVAHVLGEDQVIVAADPIEVPEHIAKFAERDAVEVWRGAMTKSRARVAMRPACSAKV